MVAATRTEDDMNKAQIIRADVVVEKPAGYVFEQWADLEGLPRFLPMVDSIEKTAQDRSHWVVHIAGVRREFDAQMTQFTRDEEISWVATGDLKHSGTVRFLPQGAERTRVDVELSWVPENLLEKAGAAMNFDESMIESDLLRFKRMLESDDGTDPLQGISPLVFP
ncbi:SRPBCC family protein [Microbacterium bovistercoris]|uniref:SRPBCC family protein n=1 Tax=Microbacterium bovistercoris TaxID=2293570 RepID=A0A371NW37_9MICO|nr:SRPBCC family protein [Microbacterium bovistercoris]REJ06321.1 SRPBCC family protein [Microbacterium bovistercoris]